MVQVEVQTRRREPHIFFYSCTLCSKQTNLQEVFQISHCYDLIESLKGLNTLIPGMAMWKTVLSLGDEFWWEFSTCSEKIHVCGFYHFLIFLLSIYISTIWSLHMILSPKPWKYC